MLRRQGPVAIAHGAGPSAGTTGLLASRRFLVETHPTRASILRPFTRRSEQMYAVVDDRNQQFRAEPGQRIQIPHQESLEPGASIVFDKICLVTGDSGKIGTPYLDGVQVKARVIGEVKGPKLVVQKIKRRKNSRTRTGFRARFTEIVIEAIEGV